MQPEDLGTTQWPIAYQTSMASNQHHHPTTTNGPCAQQSNYKVLQKHHQCPTNANRHWGNQEPSNSHVKPPAVGKKQATPSTSQQGAPRPSPKGRRILRHTAWRRQAQISTGTLPGQAIRASRSRDRLQGQTRAQAVAWGTWKELGGTRVIERSLWQGGKTR